MKGRRTIPNTVRVATGNRRRNKIKAAPNFRAGDLAKPKFSSSIAERMWPEFLKQMQNLKTLAPSHQFLLKQLCEQYADVEACRDHMRRYGRFETYHDKLGNEIWRKSAGCLALEDADRRYQKTLELAGLTPVSQNKVSPVEQDDQESGSEFF